MKYDPVLSDKKYIQVGTIGANPSSTAYLHSNNQNDARGGINDQVNVDDGNDRGLEKRMANKRGR